MMLAQLGQDSEILKKLTQYLRGVREPHEYVVDNEEDARDMQLYACGRVDLARELLRLITS